MPEPMTEAREPISGTYRFAMAACSPIVRTWGRLEVSGAECLPIAGPTLIIGNHDSHWDPVAIGIAGRERRQIRALAKAGLWDIKPLAPILNGMGQVPILRESGDAGALSAAIEQLRAGACIGVFPEGTISRGKTLRARSGIGRLAIEVPEAKLVCASVIGTVDIVRAPRRPRIRVEFFEPESGQTDPTETAGGLAVRLLAELRARAPIAIGGRRKKAEQWRHASEQEAGR